MIDRLGHRSSQLDVIIATDEQPFVHDQDESGTYFVEGVAAVGEVKTRLDGSALDDILHKGGLVRSLRPIYMAGDEIFSNPSDTARFVESIAYFAIAMESSLSEETILRRLNADGVVQIPSGTELRRLDALVVMGQGVYFNHGDGEGGRKFLDTDGETHGGWGGPFRGTALVDLFVWINTVTPRATRKSSFLPRYFPAFRPL